MTDKELILTLGAEGGSLDIYEVQTVGSESPASNVLGAITEYVAIIDETTLNEFLDEGEEEYKPHEVGRLSQLKVLLEKLDKYMWHRLWPVFCHPEYIEFVLGEKRDRDAKTGFYMGEDEFFWRKQFERGS